MFKYVGMILPRFIRRELGLCDSIAAKYKLGSSRFIIVDEELLLAAWLVEVDVHSARRAEVGGTAG